MHKTFRYPFAAVFVLALLMVAVNINAQPEGRALCHATSSAANPYNYLVLPPSGLSHHLDDNGSPLAGHEEDFFPEDNDCDRSNDPGGNEEPPPSTVPEPITMLLFGTGLAGVGYVSRRYLRKRGEENDLDD